MFGGVKVDSWSSVNQGHHPKSSKCWGFDWGQSAPVLDTYSGTCDETSQLASREDLVHILWWTSIKKQQAKLKWCNLPLVQALAALVLSG